MESAFLNGLAGPALHDSQQRSTVIHLLLGGGDGRMCDGAEQTSCAGGSYKRIRVGQGPTAHAVGAGGGYLDIFLSSLISLFFLPLSGRRPDINLNTVSKGH